MKAKPADVRHAAAVFKALSHPERLRIVCALAENGKCTQTQLVEMLRRPQSTIARHITPLRALDIVHGEREGAEVPLVLTGALTEELLDAVCNWIHGAEQRSRRTNRLLATEGEAI